MRITERTGLVYTALFLTVSVGVITQNSDRLMAAFRGESSVRAVDDIFTVQAGRDQRLFVLKNDVDSERVSQSSIQLLGQPVCGKVTISGGSFTYSDSITCSGHQSFSYCLNTGLGCEPASVALRLVELRDPIDTIANGPATELTGLEAQVSYNMEELEITNVHLGRTAPNEVISKPATGSKLARVAVETNQKINRPEPMVKVGSVEGTFEMETLPRPAHSKAKPENLVEVAATAEIRSDAQGTHDNATPTLPKSLGQTGVFPREISEGLTARMVEIDLGFVAPTIAKELDQSPFGTSCEVVLNGRVGNAGMVELDLKTSCLPNSRVEILHGKLRLTAMTDHIGNLNIEVPAFETNARFLLTLADGTELRATFNVPELEYIDRVAILWKGGFDADLHAREFGASDQSQGHVWQQMPRSADQSARLGGGWVVELGNPLIANANMAEVYSLPVSNKSKSGVVEFDVEATPNQTECSKDAVIQSLQSRGGRMIASTGTVFQLPACGNVSQGDEPRIHLKNAVRDLIIAQN